MKKLKKRKKQENKMDKKNTESNRSFKIMASDAIPTFKFQKCTF